MCFVLCDLERAMASNHRHNENSNLVQVYQTQAIFHQEASDSHEFRSLFLFRTHFCSSIHFPCLSSGGKFKRNIFDSHEVYLHGLFSVPHITISEVAITQSNLLASAYCDAHPNRINFFFNWEFSSSTQWIFAAAHQHTCDIEWRWGRSPKKFKRQRVCVRWRRWRRRTVESSLRFGKKTLAFVCLLLWVLSTNNTRTAHWFSPASLAPHLPHHLFNFAVITQYAHGNVYTIHSELTMDVIDSMKFNVTICWNGKCFSV